MSKHCSVPGCDKTARTRGYCNAHYLRLLRHGDPLGGDAPRSGEALRFLQAVASTRQTDECLPWPYTRGAGGYGQVQHKGRHALAHRLICALVHGDPPSPNHQAAHACGNPICVNPRHLSWRTHAENMADKLLHGTHNRGERHNIAKLTEAQVREIIASKGKVPQREIGEMYGVTQSLVSHIQHGRAWGWLTGVTP